MVEGRQEKKRNEFARHGITRRIRPSRRPASDVQTRCSRYRWLFGSVTNVERTPRFAVVELLRIESRRIRWHVEPRSHEARVIARYVMTYEMIGRWWLVE